MFPLKLKVWAEVTENTKIKIVVKINLFIFSP